MSTFFIRPENVASLTKKAQAELTKHINKAIMRDFMVSPRGEHLDGVGKVLVTVATMTDEKYEQYRSHGGGWEFISVVEWVCERLFYKNSANLLSSDERGAE
jgi:hypothetical protein